MLFLYTIFASLVLDLSSKLLLQHYLSEPINIIGSFLQFKLAFNEGIAFSLPLKGVLNITVSSALIIGLIRYYYKNYHSKSKFYDLAFGLLIGGALGNLRERITVGLVTDFIKVSSFPIFNLADSFIFIGVCLIIYREIKTK